MRRSVLKERGIFFRVFVLSFLLSLIIITIFSIAAIFLERNAIIKGLKSQARSVSASIAQVCGNAIFNEDYSFIVEHNLEVVQDSPDILYIVVVRRDGFSLVHMANRWEQRKKPDQAWTIGLGKVAKGVILHSKLVQQNVFHYSFPLQYSGIKWGWLHLGLSVENLNKEINSIYRVIFFLILLCLTIGVLVSYFFARRLTYPILLLHHSTSLIAKGDFSVRAKISTRDEIEDLAISFNKMAESLQKTMVSKDYLNNIIKNMNESLVVITPEGIIQIVNKATLDLLGYREDEILNQSIEIILAEEKLSFKEGGLDDLIKKKSINNAEKYYLSKEGRKIPIHFSSSKMLNGKGNIEGIVCVALDITDRKRLEEDLQKSHEELEKIVQDRTAELIKANEQLKKEIEDRKQAEEKLSQSATVFENTTEGVIITDAYATIVAVNRAFTKITGYNSEEVIGKNPKLLKSGRHDQAFYQTMWASLQEKGQWKGEIWNRRKNGEVYPQWLNISVVKNDQSEVINYVAVFSDIITLKQSEEQLKHLATHDTLTNLPNRLLFNDRLEHALEHAKRHGTKVSLLYMDLDNFKGINDSFGHPFGDRLLQVVADRLMTCLRSEDTVARLGGDEFTIITEDIFHSHDAAMVAHRLLDSLSKPIAIEGHEIFTTASIGISLFPDHGNDIHILMKNADTAMYHAKKLGRNKYQFYASEMTLLAQECIMLETALRYALERKEFILHYQPQVDVNRRQIVGVEALVRWQKPEMGLIFPNKFIPLSEEMGLISSIGEWVLHTACAQGHDWQLAGHPSLRMAVNISSREFLKKDFVEKVKQILKETGFAPSLLEIEITESTLLKNIDDNIAILKELKALGIHIAIDDFGIGYSSLSYLKQFSIDRLKIDRSFIKNIPHNSNDIAITKAIIAIARNLGIQVTAEGVETQKQMDFLISEYCIEVQGYIFSPPVPAEEFKLLLDRPYLRKILSHK